ncbi:MAG: hypothetical protein FP825_03360 [Hyphomonas sp.]|uniref:DUF4350 domain-containing protein n=1 Tax=Hyphomonas sp. TaxID=87 RepID=UPI001847E6ED|nr:DUF4350 domain-containing protein [Hyphomonas sp.]MBA3067503.1 hypothetical protein [Hyphomonas sp.]MBU3921924.1 hypothetical protein [Alphaproteobacteria bacterium]MBU4063391.1 hypothetical protein [Alphaproteobacteria bacterium]MBU4165211.1 hypothetical protein [Alphaproteobacteria bacterium]
MSDTAPPASPFSARVVAILIAVAAISFGAVLVLAGWAPELRDRNQAGDHPYSTSALGYNGLVRLLDAAGYPVSVSRLQSDLDARSWGLMIITLPAYGSFDALEDRSLSPTTLIVLPKWTGRTDPLNTTRQIDTELIEAGNLADQISAFYPDAEILRVEPPETVEAPYGTVAVKPDLHLQLIKHDSLEPLIEVEGGALLAYDPVHAVYVLSDPDMINTFGLASQENARFAVQLVDFLRYDADEPILLDATLHGFERSENLLKMMFSVPYIGVTLVALAAVLLLGWAATIRFGPPLAEARAIALGKQALADNSAGLVTMARRETRMAPGFLALVRRRLARQIGAPRTLSEAQVSELFDRLGPDPETGRVFSQMEADLKDPATSRDDLLAKTRALYRWRKDVIRRTLYERD